MRLLIVLILSGNIALVKKYVYFPNYGEMKYF